MSKSIAPISILFTLLVLLTAATSILAQVDQARPRPEPAPTLGCCRCLGGTNTLDLSTVSSNSWTVNNNAVAFLAQIHPLWNINPGPAQWVSTVATGGTGIIPKVTFDYSLKFIVPRCAIEQRVTLTGNFGGDDDVSVYLDTDTSMKSETFSVAARSLSTSCRKPASAPQRFVRIVSFCEGKLSRSSSRIWLISFQRVVLVE